MSHYDVIVIGAGPGGYEVASLLGKAGKSVAIIEKNENQIGGTCLNEGCVPAKLYLESATYIAKKSYFESCGVEIESIKFNMLTLKNKKHELITQLRDGIKSKLKNSQAQIIYGTATFINEHTLQVNEETLNADKFIIASGSMHRPHPLLELDGKQIISSREAFELDKIPSSILIVGGGAIGCEFATFFNSLGSKVHIAEFTPNIVPVEDEDVSKGLKRELEKKGITISLNTNVTTCIKNDASVSITMETPKGTVEVDYKLILVSIGRAPNTKELNLEKAGVKTDRSFIAVNENLLTTNPNIYAIGDVIPTPALAHAAYNEAKIVSLNIIEESKNSPSTVIPFVTFCQPQVASIGLSEKALKASGREYNIIKHFFKSSAKAKIKGDDGGFLKLLMCKESGVILGGAMIGNDVTELIHELLIVINANVTKDELAKMVFAHPTLSESLWEMVK
jgi:dihydrolipoamide dehydrogenase